jgi:hypothetical protein
MAAVGVILATVASSPAGEFSRDKSAELVAWPWRDKQAIALLTRKTPKNKI